MFKKIIIWPLFYLTILAHLMWRSLLPHPLHHLDIITIFFLLYIIFSSGKKLFLLAIPAIIILELYQSSPFGILSIVFLISVISWHWIINYATTNRSIPIIFLFSIVAITLYRILYLFMGVLLEWATKITYLPTTAELLSDNFWIIFLSSLATTILYVIITNIFKRLNPRYIINN